MKILGVDPGTTRLGFAVLEDGMNLPRLLASGVIGSASGSHAERLTIIYTELTSLIREHQPDIVAVEKLYFSKNVKTALSVAEARGIILLTATQAKSRVYECTPQDVKLALTGHGRASKYQVAQMVQRLVRLERKKRPDDETDAIAIALTAFALARHQPARESGSA